MGTKVYIGNLAADTTENELSDLFSAYYNIVDVGIPLDPTIRRPRRFCFVTMVTGKVPAPDRRVATTLVVAQMHQPNESPVRSSVEVAFRS